MGSTKTKGIIVELGGDATGLNKAISSVSAEARSTQTELKKIDRLLKMDPSNITLLKQKQDLLNQSMEKTGDAVQALKDAKDKADRDMADGTEVSQKAYRELERQIEANEIKMRDARKEADKVAAAIKDIQDGSLHDVADAADDAQDSLENAKTEAASFGDVLKAGAIIEGAKGIVDSLKNVAEETKEYRKVMGSLDVSSEAAGYTAEQTEEAYTKLYGVLGDEQSSATTLANLQALGLSQEQLLVLIERSIGGWAKYGDSIPIDSLAESINETAKAGQVTGTLADILNWGADEGETFGVQLMDLSDLQSAYADATAAGSDASEEYISQLEEQIAAGEAWNQAVMDAKTAEDYFNLALQQCSTESERANLIMQAMADQGLATASERWRENNASMVEANETSAGLQEQMAILGEQIEPIVTRLTGLVVQALAWFNSLDQGTQTAILGAVAVVAALGPVMAAFSGVSTSINGVMTILPQLQTTFSTVLGFITSNPIVLLVAAIVALVALIATKGDEIQGILQTVDSFLQGVFVTDWTTVFGPVLGNILNGFMTGVRSIWESIKKIFNGILDFIRGVFTGDWERAWNGVKDIFGGIFDGLVALVEAPINMIIGLVNSAIAGINSLIEGANSVPGVEMGTIPEIPMLAKGGTVWSGSAIVGEAGPELLTVDSGRAIVQPLTNSTTNHNANHFGSVSISVYGAPGQDVRELAELVMEEMQTICDQENTALS